MSHSQIPLEKVARKSNELNMSMTTLFANNFLVVVLLMPGTVEKNMQHLKNMGKARAVSYIVKVVIVYDTVYTPTHTHKRTVFCGRLCIPRSDLACDSTLHGSKLLAHSGLKISLQHWHGYCMVLWYL